MVARFPSARRHRVWNVNTFSVEDTDTIGHLMAHAILRDIPIERASRGFIQPRAVILKRKTSGT